MSGDFIFREVVGVKFVIQRVLHASVTVDGVRIAQIGKGSLVLVGIGREDTTADADRLVDKLVKLRIFEDESGKTNRSLSDVNLRQSRLLFLKIGVKWKSGLIPCFT